MTPMSAGGPEGHLEIRVAWDGERIVAVEPRSARPVDACRVLEGRPAAEALALVPRLFSLCGRAQATTASMALAAAGAPDVAVPADADRAVAVESVLESLWRLLHDLPRALGAEPEVAAFATVRRALLASLDGDAAPGALAAALAQLETLLDTTVLGVTGPGVDAEAYAGWLATAATPVAGWLRDLDARGFGSWGQGATPLMPARPGGEALRELAMRLAAEPGFAHRPDWLGRPVETGALAARQDAPLVRGLRASSGHGCATRFAARLVDLRELVDGLVGRGPLALSGSLPLDADAGLGWALTARGLLLHTAALVDGGRRIAAYRVVAPTEWNFHPAGALVRGLEAQPATGEAELRRGVTLAVLALDPCVGFDLAVDTRHVALAEN